MKCLKSAVLALLTACVALPANAAIWQIGWDSLDDGGLELFALSTDSNDQGSYDDFEAYPSWFQLDDQKVDFIPDAVVYLDGCFDLGGAAGTCNSDWNGLGLDGVVTAPTNGNFTGSYGKYTSVSVSADALAAMGYSAGLNEVVLDVFSGAYTWAPRDYTGLPAANITLASSVASVPEPQTLALFALGLAGMGVRYRRARR
ncbi:PEP-CTERM sorting domain-containing protein [Marinobacter sp. HL-58]|uniref:PEP-CTERM sorting domain-containing protein n=1 Tax=Marinobacter sp. HL-58 TaxID=1479237 RepID=UPI000488DEE2|nr:PEP-CTERM sorting domain-containing protein [Marinobacter sp. HL-58]KPQ03175.1 MAG: secreted protein [Marinobacter sp. HL-58]